MTGLLRNNLETLRNTRKNKNESGFNIHEQRLRRSYKEDRYLIRQTNDLSL